MQGFGYTLMFIGFVMIWGGAGNPGPVQREIIPVVMGLGLLLGGNRLVSRGKRIAEHRKRIIRLR